MASSSLSSRLVLYFCRRPNYYPFLRFIFQVECKTIEAADKAVSLMKAIAAHSKVSEPGTLMYRVSQFERFVMLIEE